MAQERRPVPFRTRKLRPGTAMVLHPTGCGRVARRRTTRQGPQTRPKPRGPPHTQTQQQPLQQKNPCPRFGVAMHISLRNAVPLEQDHVRSRPRRSMPPTRPCIMPNAYRAERSGVYRRAEYCGTWHLTHRDPAHEHTYVPLNQQIKPHSRKKGYKPRWR